VKTFSAAPERRFDSPASLENKADLPTPERNQQDTTLGTQYSTRFSVTVTAKPS